MDQLKQLESVWRLGGRSVACRWLGSVSQLDLPTECQSCSDEQIANWQKHFRGVWQPYYILEEDRVAVQCSACFVNRFHSRWISFAALKSARYLHVRHEDLELNFRGPGDSVETT